MKAIKNFLRRLLWLPVYFIWKHFIAPKTTTTTLLGFSLTIRPGVFHPRFILSSKFFGEFIQKLSLENTNVLDMGTGSGIQGIIAASRGANVVAIDINEEAVFCAQRNAEQNRVAERMTFLHGNLFSPLEEYALQQFDFIFFNPPFYPKKPTTIAQYARNAGVNYEIIHNFVQQARTFLSEKGKIYFIISSDVDVEYICSLFVQHHFHIALAAEKKMFFETLFIYEIK